VSSLQKVDDGLHFVDGDHINDLHLDLIWAESCRHESQLLIDEFYVTFQFPVKREETNLSYSINVTAFRNEK
jgi:hypothetical protein